MKMFPVPRCQLRRCAKSVRWKVDDAERAYRSLATVAQTSSSPFSTLLKNLKPDASYHHHHTVISSCHQVFEMKPGQQKLLSRGFATAQLKGNVRQKENLTDKTSDQSTKANRTETALVDVIQQGALTDEEVKQREYIRALVSQLYMALNVPETYQQDMENMQNQLDEIKAALKPLEEEKLRLLIRAERRSKVLAWAGLGFMGTQFGFLARLTWWEYSWDIIEPVTYFVTYGTAMVLYSYFLVTRQDTNFPAMTERWTAVAFHKKARKSKWEMNRYIELRGRLAKLQTDLERMNVSKFTKTSKLTTTGEGLRESAGTAKASDSTS
ncbi:hypothetical protein RvY_08382 [Ramazzottius varieornatus]|uniref:Calcium uniporter protein n=1 Tax=Ramazzottius varieornatus TaxID=947166 RepID=A0A1D1V5L4_RAMVA|nr:hypothetical protein RvY_08382 [Ramazzottius varieornatus]